MDRLPSPSALTRIHALWDELADFGAVDASPALDHLLQATAALVGGQNAYWLGVVRMTRDEPDDLCGWRPRVVQYLRSVPADEARARRFMREYARGITDESARAHARQAGTFRASLIRELVSAEWFESDVYKALYEARGYVDALFVIFPVNDSAECYYGYYRDAAHGRFTEEDRATAAYAIRGLKWFHRLLMLNHGLIIARSPVTRTESRVLRLLLTDIGEKEIADRLGLTTATTHKYVTDLLRKYGVSGRAGLTALWLGRATAAPAD